MIEKIVSGGQTGVDRAALDCAITLAIPHGGWCPAGRRAEDGTIPEHYRLVETDAPDYAARTRKNVEDSDATLVLNRNRLEGGTAATLDFARHCNRPAMVVDLDNPPAPNEIRNWLVTNRIKQCNVAGPRESKCPGIYRQARHYLETILAPTLKGASKN